MAVVHRVKRIANPRGRRRMRVGRNSKGRFVRVEKVARRKVRKATPKRHAVKRRVVRRRANPVLIELGAINPHNFGTKKRRKNPVARKIRRNARRRVRAVANPQRRRRTHVARRVVRRRRRNPVVVVTRRRASNPRWRRHHYSRRRRNPAFGHGGGKNLILMTGGILVGVAATKYLPTLVPASITGMFGVSPVVSTLITIAGAFAAQMIAAKILPGAFSDAVLLGGLALAGSRALDSFAPPQLSQALALSGVGDIVPGYFAVPQNSVTNRAPSPQMMVATKGVGRAFGGGFGNRR